MSGTTASGTTAAGQPAATLTGDLLAAKGRATAQGFKPAPAPVLAAVAQALPSPPAGDAAASDRVTRLGLGSSGGGPGGGPGDGKEADRRIKSTIRLDPERHRRLKLLSAHLGKSGLDILIEALDLYMDRVGADQVGGPCHCLYAAPTPIRPDRA